ncbi:hypothetical protein BGZ76_006009 [Entomortierella beljakovae]|nr:hypothetical protein BGZ76_006009 [Entomortierella beljakovae]
MGDGKNNYAFARVYRTKPNSEATYDDPFYNLLIKSDADLESYRKNGWSFLSAIPADVTRRIDTTRFNLCQVDSDGVVTLVSTGCKVNRLTDSDTCGLQWDPRISGEYVVGAGGWTLFDGAGMKMPLYYTGSTLALISGQMTVIFKTLRNIEYSIMGKSPPQFSAQEILRVPEGLGNISSIAYENSKLYVAGANDGIYLANTPLINVTPQNTSEAPVLNVDVMPNVDPADSCLYGSFISTHMSVFGNATYILCSSEPHGSGAIRTTSTIYQHNGVNWTAPMTMNKVPWYVGHIASFINSTSGHPWIIISDRSLSANRLFSIEIHSNNTVTWGSENAITIEEGFTDQVPSTKNNTITIAVSVAAGVIFLIVIGVVIACQRKKKALKVGAI